MSLGNEDSIRKGWYSWHGGMKMVTNVKKGERDVGNIGNIIKVVVLPTFSPWKKRL